MSRPSLALMLAAVVASCAPLPPRGTAPPPEAIEARRALVRPITQWELQGRVGVRLPDDGAQASVRWRRQSDRQEIDLTGPFGGGHVRLQYDGGGARLRDARARVYEGDDPETLLYRVTGWQFPLDGLVYWVRGLPMPHAAHDEVLDEHGRLRSLKQSGWDIEFLAYTDAGGVELPSKLYMTRRLPAAGGDATARIEVRLAISDWAIGR